MTRKLQDAPRGYASNSEEEFDAFVVGFDGSQESGLALQNGIELARRTGAKLKVVAVAELPPIAYGKGGGAMGGWNELREAIEERLRQQLDEPVSAIPDDDVTSEVSLVSGDPAVKLADAGQARGTVLVLGSRAYGPMRRVLLGSVSAALVKAAPCPVVVHSRGTRVDAATAQSVEAGSASCS